MGRVVVLVLMVMGCKGKDADAPADDLNSPTPCVVGSDVCIVFDSRWSARNASAECDALDGVREACPADPLGDCATDDGLTYRLYDMNPMDAAGYCEYLKGEWQVSS